MRLSAYDKVYLRFQRLHPTNSHMRIYTHYRPIGLSYFAVFMLAVMAVAVMSSHAFAQSENINLRFGKHLEKDRFVLDFAFKQDASVFTLSNPNRLVVDLPRDNWTINVSDTVKKSAVKNIRIGDFQNNTSRIVIDMEGTTNVTQSFWLPASQTGGKNLKDRLVIDFVNEAGAAPPSQRQDTVKRGAPPTTLDEMLARTLSQQTAQPVTNQSANNTIIPGFKPPYNAGNPDIYKAVVRKPMVVIDPGHGGKDSGAVAKNGLYEKTVVLKLAKELARALQQTGRYNVHLTRSDDRYIALRKRVEIARQKKADLFVSIHADSIGNGKVSGASVYTLSAKASDAQTAKLAARENKSDMIAGLDLEEQDQEVANILLDLVTRETTNQSKFFANLIVNEFQQNEVKTLQRPHRHAGFAVLKAPDVPAILVESGFMSNAREARLLNDPNHRAHIVEALRMGIDAYFERLASLQ